MAQGEVERRLAAILVADVVGYSRLVGADEEGTIARLKALREELIDPSISKHNGRIVKTTGDGLLVEFASVVDAVRNASEVQRAMAEHNADVPESDRIVLRIGVNLGDVVIEGDDILGDGVNVAARLEGLAEPGGICISGTTFDQVRDKLEVGYEYLGEQEVKNIARSVRAYRVLMEPERAGEVVGVAKHGSSSRVRAAAATALLIVVAGGGAWWWQAQPDFEPADPAKMAYALPEKPSIAVLPFQNLSDDKAQEYFADGMAEDLITDLSKVSGLFVIARNSSFSYKGQQVKVRQVAEDLGVRYVLEGSVRRIGDQVRINIQLVDATTGGHVWAERYDRELDNIFAVQDEILERVVQALELHLTDTEQQRRDKGPKTTSLEAYDLVLKARKLMTRFDHKAATEARDLLQRAVEIDPAYTEAYSLLGFHYFDEWRVWGRKRDQNLSRALELATTAVELTPLDPSAHVLLAMVYQWRREFDAANTEADTALALQPNDAITLSNLGSMLRWAHRSEEAISVLNEAVRLDPFHPPNYLDWLASAYAGVGDYDQCVEVAKRGVALDPNYVGLHVNLAACYAALGREEDAQATAAEILRTNPRFTLKAFASYAPFSDERDLQHKVKMLRQAGVPESADEVFRKPDGHMTGDRIRAAISGQTFVDTLPARFAGTIMTFDPSGTLNGHPRIGSPAEQFGSDQGRWWIEGDKFCRKWNRWVSGSTECFSFVPDGQSIKWIDRYGQFNSEMEKLD